MSEWREALQDVRETESLLGRFSLLGENLLVHDLRNRKIVQRLGEIAATMSNPTGGDKPVLLNLLGRGHSRGLKHLLRSNDIPFKVVNDKPSDRAYYTAQSAKALASPRSLERRWIASAEKQLRRNKKSNLL